MSDTGGENGDGRGERVVFRYDRDSRIEKAGEDVKWLTSLYEKKSKNPFAAVFQNRAFMLGIACVAIVTAFFYFSNAVGKDDSPAKGRIGGETVELSAYKLEDTSIIFLERERPEGPALKAIIFFDGRLIGEIDTTGRIGGRFSIEERGKAAPAEARAELSDRRGNNLVLLAPFR